MDKHKNAPENDAVADEPIAEPGEVKPVPVEEAVVEAPETAEAPAVEDTYAPGYETRVVDANLRSTSYGAILDSSHDQAAEDEKAASE